ncbi:RDD family protein [Chryseobacterium jejuense]|uniref:RDD family n=1 Tax=Chryseobacterium jejuense TaxID=445960 RepID=A0A2X2Z4F5_CHRJE|nr:RDD family protein [Chryseobacterium jejuense]SDJ32475.1 RDD family protein [Chryseobacterium jejuense]SQB45360.1 RDD family [Chryseobacterium jejuense]
MNDTKSKFIAYSSLLTLLLGILTSIIFYNFYNGTTISSWISYFYLLKPLSLYVTHSEGPFNLWETIIYFILFLGTVFFLKTKGKEKRLLGFVFSVVLINNIMLVLFGIFNWVYFSFNPPSGIALEAQPTPITSIMKLLIQAFYIIMSFLVLKKIKQENEKKVTIAAKELKYTVQWQRGLHLLIDSLVIVGVFTNFAWMFSHSLQGNHIFQSYFNNYFGLVIIIVLIRLIFYPVFEFYFGSTPAKFLTESRVVDKHNNQPGLKTIFKRSLYRSIPFDGLSFFGKNGWHDSLSETYVIKEETEGIHSKHFLWILVFVVPLLSYNYFIKGAISDHQYSKSLEKEEGYDVQWYNNSRMNINTNQFYVVQAIDYAPDNNVLGLKVEEIKGDAVKVKKIKLMGGFSNDFWGVKMDYDRQIDSAQVYTISRMNLENMFPQNKIEKLQGTHAQDLFNNGIKYNFNNVYEVNVPYFDLGNTFYDTQQETRNNSGKFIIGNRGKSGKVISVKNIKGDMIWKDRFPIVFGAAKGSTEEKVVLKTNYSAEIKNNTSEITVADSLNNQQNYILEINEGAFKIYRIK